MIGYVPEHDEMQPEVVYVVQRTRCTWRTPMPRSSFVGVTPDTFLRVLLLLVVCLGLIAFLVGYFHGAAR